MKNSKWMIGSLIAAVLALGFFSGVLLSHWQIERFMRHEFRGMEPHGLGPHPGPGFEPGPEGRRDDRGVHLKMADRLLHELTRSLDLSEAQQQQIQKILESHAAEIQQAQETFRSNMGKIIRQTDSEIAACLTPDQKKKFEEKRGRFKP